MLNLTDLEKRLDVALEAETNESLTNWLMSKRFGNYIADSGEGEFDILIPKSSKSYSYKDTKVKITGESPIIGSPQYAEAA